MKMNGIHCVPISRPEDLERVLTNGRYRRCVSIDMNGNLKLLDIEDLPEGIRILDWVKLDGESNKCPLFAVDLRAFKGLMWLYIEARVPTNLLRDIRLR